MSPTASTPLLLLVAALAAGCGAFLLGGCASESTQTIQPKVDRIEYRRDARGVEASAGQDETTYPDGSCRHVYMQVGIHAWSPPDALAERLCVINQCARCGRIVHECQRQRE